MPRGIPPRALELEARMILDRLRLGTQRPTAARRSASNIERQQILGLVGHTTVAARGRRGGPPLAGRRRLRGPTARGSPARVRGVAVVASTSAVRVATARERDRRRLRLPGMSAGQRPSCSSAALRSVITSPAAAGAPLGLSSRAPSRSFGRISLGGTELGRSPCAIALIVRLRARGPERARRSRSSAPAWAS